MRVKHAFLFARSGIRRQLDLFLPGEFSAPLPIHCWLIEHEDRVWLIDSGEHASVRDIPFAHFEVTPEQELPSALRAAGFAAAEISEVVLTHHHGDHVDGLAYVPAPGRMHAEEIRFMEGAFPRVMRRALRQPLPAGFAPQPFTLEQRPFGVFERSLALSEDRRIVAVDTPGHTPGHVSIICIDDEGRHVMLAGDATDTLEQLLARRPDAVGPSPRVHVATLERILAHCAQHPTVYLPSHDPESAMRLAEGTIVSLPGGTGAGSVDGPGGSARASVP